MTDIGLLHVNNLQVNIGDTALVRGVSFKLQAGDALGIVGESGCGKSLTALSIMRLLSQPPMHIESGDILFNGQNLVQMPEKSLEKIRGREIAMIFQEPMTSLNPVFNVGEQVSEVLYLHEKLSTQSAQLKTNELFDKVGLSASRIADRFPHQLSGGQRQRVMIAMSLACSPKLLIADEPTTALDVTVQAQILELIDELRQELGMAILLIAHDLGLVRHHCNQVAVMYAGQIVEYGSSRQVFSSPSHPYTRALIETIPAVNEPGKPLPSIGGTVPAPAEMPQGCAFSPRCKYTQERCTSQAPELAAHTNIDHQVRCWFPVSDP
ncbi:MAG: oligopeptide/dipeptide ABC transporter ATP-binding protein [Granulosicoccus sp.]|jgi:oligopeptide/dipeptide ABC transporter ATP-binding protein